jgi:hypothetical protein
LRILTLDAAEKFQHIPGVASVQSKLNRESSPLTQRLRNFFGFGTTKKKVGRGTARARRRVFLEALEDRRVLAVFAIDNPAPINEGNAGTQVISFTISRDDATAAATIDYQTSDGTATAADNDYVAVGLTTLNFAIGEFQKIVDITINGDNKPELNESFAVNLSNVSAGNTIGDNQGISAIANDDFDWTIEGTGGADSITLVRSGANLIASGLPGGNIVVPAAPSNGALNSITINGLGGADTVTIDYSGGNFPVASLTVNGGDPTTNPGDRLVTTGGNFATGTSNPTNGNDGAIVYIGGTTGDSTINYTGLEPIDDLNVVVNYAINATNALNFINIVDGPIVLATQTTQVNDGAGLFELVNFANKTNVTINALDGGDQIAINNPNKGVGLATLIVNGGAGDDQFNIHGPGIVAGTTYTFNGGDDNDLFSVSGGLLPAPITINGNAHTGVTPSTSDRLTVNSFASNVTKTATQLQFSGGSAITYGTLEQINLNNLNTLSVSGTGAADSDVLSKPSATTYRSVLNGGVEVNFDAPLAAVGAQYFSNLAGGSDTLTVDNTGRVVNLRVGFNAGAGVDDTLNVFGNPGAAIARESYITGASQDAGRLVLDPDGNMGFLKTSVVAANGDELDVSFNGLDPINTDVPSVIFDVVLSAAVDQALLTHDGVLLNGFQSMLLADILGTFEDTRFANKTTFTASGFTAADLIQWNDNGSLAAGLTNVEFYGFLPVGLGVDDAPASNANRDVVQYFDSTGVAHAVTFDHSDTASVVNISGLTAAIQIGTAETILFTDGGVDDDVVILGTSGDDDLTVFPYAANSALVFSGGDPWDGPSEGSMFDQFPGIAGGSSAPDIRLVGVNQLNMDGGVAGAAGNQLYVYGQSETSLTTGALDYFGFGAGVLIPSAATLGFPNAFDQIFMSDTQVNIGANDGAIALLPVNVIAGSFVQANQFTYGLIVNSGDEAAPGIPDSPGILRADNIFLSPSAVIPMLINGGDPVPAFAPEGDKLNIEGTFKQIDVFSDKSTPPVVSMVFTPNVGPGSLPFSFSSIENIGALAAPTVRLIGDNNNPAVDQNDNFVVRGQDTDSALPGNDGPPPGDADGCEEFVLVINGSIPIPFYGVSFLKAYGDDQNPPPGAPSAGNDIDTLDIRPYADNTPEGWCIDVFFNEGNPPGADGDQADLIIYHTSLGLGGGGSVSEDITVAPSGPDNGEINVLNHAFGTPIVAIQYVANTDIIFVDDDAALSDIDTITLLGTVPQTAQTSGNDRFTVDFDAAGGVATPKVVVEDLAGPTILYRVRDFIGFSTINVQPLAGNDTVTVAGAIPANFTVDAGAGNDTVSALAAVVGNGLTIFGGDGDDTLTGSPNSDAIYGGVGNDILIGGAGVDHLYGEAGNDRFGDLANGNATPDDGGNDFFFGGEGSDTFVWDPGDGSDTIEGGGDESDVMVFNGNAGAEQFTLSAVGTRLRLFRAQGNINMDIAGVEHVALNPLGGADTVTVNDLYLTEVKLVTVDAGVAGVADAAADIATVNGRNLTDVVSIDGAQNAFTVSGLRYEVVFNNLNDATDSFTFAGNGGGDFISSSLAAFAGIFTLSGGDGDDTLVGGAANEILLGGNGNDFIDAGLGLDTLRGGDGDDVMIPGNDGLSDTVDGGAGWDAILFRGTAFRDGITAIQTSDIAVTYTNTTGAVSETDNLVALTVEELRIEAGGGNDTVLISQDAALFTAPGLQMSVDGGSATTQDRLGVIDAGAANATIQRLGADGASGTFNIGQVAAAIVYTNVEYARLEGINPVTGLGANGGRLYVFKVDGFEQNGSIPNASHLGVGETLNEDPTIDPGADNLLGLNGDEDFYRVEALKTGTLDFQVFFRPDADLPGGGNLTVTVHDSTGAAVPGAFAVAGATGARVRVPAVQGQIYYLRVDGASEQATNVYSISVVNEAAPTPFALELDDVIVNPGTNPPGAALNSDTGRSQHDNITFDTTPAIIFRLNDRFFTSDIPGNDAVTSPPIGLVPINFSAAANVPGFRIAIFDEGPLPVGLPQTPLGFATPVAGSPGVYSFTSPVLAQGSHFLTARVQMVDPVHGNATGFGERSLPLEIVVDTTPPAIAFGLATTVGDGLDAASDSGVDGNPGTFADRITNDTTPSFWGQAEANSIVRLYVDSNNNGTFDAATDLLVGQTVATPLDGTNQLPGGRWDITVTTDLNNIGIGKDGLRTLFITAEDVAGNLQTPPGIPQTIRIFIDTAGPQVTNVQINSAASTYDLFDPKPSTDGPTPLVNSLVISVRDLPNRRNIEAPFLYNAQDNTVTLTPGNYIVKGDANGIIPIQTITFVPDAPVNNAPATGRVVLGFFKPLPDDRYTLTIRDDVVDPAGNNLDGESNAAEPRETTTFPSGDGQPGGDFIARFTIDTRPEVGVWNSGSIYVDTNGNHIFDPTNTDHVNRDITYVMGFASDNVFAGNFTLKANGVADGFDKIAAYGKVGSKFRWLIDFNNDGVSDFDKADGLNRNGLPVAGNFDGNLVNGDEVGIFTGTSWIIDTNHDFKMDTEIASNMVGRPVVGDFNGDGQDDFATWADDKFYIDLNRDGQFDTSFRFGFPGVRERPVAADMDKDGRDDLGLWSPDRDGGSLRETGEYYFLVSGGASVLNRIQNGPLGPEIRYRPTPFGNDFSIAFGDETAQPIVGNFDPPIAPDGSVTPLPTNPSIMGDVNNDGVVSTRDALLVLEALNDRNQSATSTSVYMVDVNGDGRVSTADVLAVISALSDANRTAGNGAGEAGSRNPAVAAPVTLVVSGAPVATSPAASIDQAIGQVADEVAEEVALGGAVTLQTAPVATDWASDLRGNSKKTDKALIDLFG